MQRDGKRSPQADRAERPKALAQLNEDDVLMVARLARSTRDLFNTLATIIDRKAGSRSSVPMDAASAVHLGRRLGFS